MKYLVQGKYQVTLIVVIKEIIFADNEDQAVSYAIENVIDDIGINNVEILDSDEGRGLIAVPSGTEETQP